MKQFKRILSCMLIVCLLVSLAPAAFAAEDQNEPVGVYAWGEGTATETYGNITTDTDGEALYVGSDGGGAATVVVEGDVTADTAGGPPYTAEWYDENGNVYTYDATHMTGGTNTYSSGDGSVTELEVQGDVGATIGEGEASGVVANAYNGGTNDVSVGGSVEAEGCCGTAVSAYTENGDVSVDVGEDVSYNTVPASEGNDNYWSAEGVHSVAALSGTAEVSVGGDVSVTAEDGGVEAVGVNSGATGASWEWDEETQSYVEVTLGADDPAGSSSIAVEGSVDVSGQDEAVGVRVNADTFNTSEVTVGGNVSVSSEENSASGVSVYSYDDGSGAVSVGGSVEAEGVSGAAVNVYAKDGDASAEIDGDVSFNVIPASESNEYYWHSAGIESTSNLSGTAEVSVGGDVTVTDESGRYECIGVYALAEGFSWEWNEETHTSVRVDPEPDAPAGSSSVAVDGSVDVSGQGRTTAVSANAHGAVSSEVTIGGDVSAATEGLSATAVNAYGTESGSVTVTVGGDVSAEAKLDATAINVDSYAGSATVIVDGDVSAESEKYATGISAHAQDCCSTAVLVDGSVSAEGEDADGIFAWVSRTDSQLDVQVNGDVTGSSTGLTVYVWGLGNEEVTSSLSITVDGTVSGGEKSIFVSGQSQDSDAITLTVWKVDLDEDGSAVSPLLNSIDDYNIDPSDEYYDTLKAQIEDSNAQNTAFAEELEENILYIIRLVQPEEGGTLSLSGTTQSDGFDVAKEGDNVILLISVADGYQIDAAYNGEGARVELQQDADGNYFLVVPKGGGVSLSAALSLIPVSPVYTAPVRRIVAKSGDAKLNIESAVKDENGDGVNVKVQVFFYDDNTFDVVIGEGPATTHVRGSYKFVDGVLTLVLKDGSEVKLADGNILSIPLPTGSTLEIKLDQAAIDALVKAAK
ncbi:MAG: hypothetical protein IJP64_07190 [Oscillospiraceae bacterium]|nr:hypothetical protein [Oscillospiraceae bacterium]